jgi:SAM-dependent methyltransferase
MDRMTSLDVETPPLPPTPINPPAAPSAETQGPPTPPQQALAEHVRGEYLRMAADAAALDASRWARTTCRACLSSELIQVMDLGAMPPANALLKPSDISAPEPRFPLTLNLCQHCGMVQLGHVVPAELLFRSYLFFTSSSRAMSDHFAKLMADATRQFVKPGGLIVEIGSNDGTSLSSIARRDVRVLGIDPARNIAVMAAARGVPTVSEFFTEPLSREVARVAGTAQLIVACNVLGHIDDLDDVCRGVKTLLAPGGALVVEVPYLGELVSRAEYDTIYHEHLSYFAVRPLAALFNRHGLRIEAVHFFTVHGGTMRLTVGHGDGVSEAVAKIIEKETADRLGERETLIEMSRRAEANRTWLRNTLYSLLSQGKKVLGYGAPAKGAVALNYCNIGPFLLPAVFDSTPAKQGWCIPGTHQPILPPARLHEENPDVLLLLAWNHADEIMARETAFRARGGKFITPHGQGDLR